MSRTNQRRREKLLTSYPLAHPMTTNPRQQKSMPRPEDHVAMKGCKFRSPACKPTCKSLNHFLAFLEFDPSPLPATLYFPLQTGAPYRSATSCMIPVIAWATLLCNGSKQVVLKVQHLRCTLQRAMQHQSQYFVVCKSTRIVVVSFVAPATSTLSKTFDHTASAHVSFLSLICERSILIVLVQGTTHLRSMHRW